MYYLLGSPKPIKMTNSFAAIEVVHQCIAMFAQFPAMDRLIRPNQDAHHQRLDRLFLAAASKEPPTLVVLLRARFRAPLPLPPEWRDTHASQQTNSQQPDAAQPKKSDLPPQICGGCVALDGERGYAPS